MAGYHESPWWQNDRPLMDRAMDIGPVAFLVFVFGTFFFIGVAVAVVGALIWTVGLLWGLADGDPFWEVFIILWVVSLVLGTGLFIIWRGER